MYLPNPSATDRIWYVKLSGKYSWFEFSFLSPRLVAVLRLTSLMLKVNSHVHYLNKGHWFYFLRSNSISIEVIPILIILFIILFFSVLFQMFFFSFSFFFFFFFITYFSVVNVIVAQNKPCDQIQVLFAFHVALIPVGKAWNYIFSFEILINKKVKVKLATVIESDPKAPFLIATTPKRRERHYSFPWMAPLYPWCVPYNAEC